MLHFSLVAGSLHMLVFGIVLLLSFPCNSRGQSDGPGFAQELAVVSWVIDRVTCCLGFL